MSITCIPWCDGSMYQSQKGARTILVPSFMHVVYSSKGRPGLFGHPPHQLCCKVHRTKGGALLFWHHLHPICDAPDYGAREHEVPRSTHGSAVKALTLSGHLWRVSGTASVMNE